MARRWLRSSRGGGSTSEAVVPEEEEGVDPVDAVQQRVLRGLLLRVGRLRLLLLLVLLLRIPVLPLGVAHEPERALALL